MSLPVDVTFRPLFHSEYSLASGEEGVIWPESAVLLGAWRGEKLVGRIGSVVLPHIEGIWVDENEREAGGAIARELHRQIESAARSLGRPAIFVYCPEDQPGMALHLSRAGYEKIPFTLWAKKLEE
jgi:hypothetical protein